MLDCMSSDRLEKGALSSSKKAIVTGTHRACQPEETLARVIPFLPQMGITRIAEITHLDNIGIPVFQAIRPNSRNISLSQGKGITKALAKVSAVMESIEGWHAEQPELPCIRATVGDMAPSLPYSLFDLNLDSHHLIHDALELEWSPARLLGTAEPQETFLPTDYVRLDFTISNEWLLPTFFTSSNGLASGNVYIEACLHALYEIIERDTFEMVRRRTLQKVPLDPLTVDGSASASLIEQLQRAGVTMGIFVATGPTGITCFEASIISPGCPVLATGYGCHLDRDVALSRALTEAAQSRLTIIAGARDDIGRTPYDYIQHRLSLPKMRKQATQGDFRDIPSSISDDLAVDLQEVIQRLLAIYGLFPLVVDLTHQTFNIPVVFVVMPKLGFLESLA